MFSRADAHKLVELLTGRSSPALNAEAAAPPDTYIMSQSRYSVLRNIYRQLET